MGSVARKIVTFFLISSSCFAAADTDGALKKIREQISTIQHDLTDSSARRTNSVSQLKKIRKLLTLQSKEITLSQNKIGQLNSSLDELAGQRAEVAARVEREKNTIRSRIMDLYKVAEIDQFNDRLKVVEALHFDLFAQKSFFLKKNLEREFADVTKLQEDVQHAMALELKILEERNKLDYYVLELKDKAAELSADKQIHEEIMKTNRVNHLEALRRIQALRESERELEKMLGQFESRAERATAGGASTLAGYKGKLLIPVGGAIVGRFGRSFNPRTNLLTFQKGISIDAASGSEVRAVHDGQVVYKGELKNYGSVVIVEHPGQYFSLYGQLSNAAVKEGNVLRAGDKIGITSHEPFYFEIRSKNVALNPMPWFSEGTLLAKKGDRNVQWQ